MREATEQVMFSGKERMPKEAPGTIPHWLPAVAIALLACAVYVNSFPGIFVLDDFHIVVNNPLVQSPDLAKILRADYWGYGQNTGLYRPLTILSLALNRYLFGAGPLGFHLVNVLLHAAVAVLVLRVLTAWDFPKAVAWGGAALFAVHPIHTEVVNEAVGRSELLVAFFLLLALIAARRNSRWSHAAVCACFLLALLSKEHAFTFLLLLPALEGFHARSLAFVQKRRGLYLSLLAVALLWLAWRHWGVVHLTPPDVVRVFNLEGVEVSTVTRVLTALKLQWFYLGKLVAPVTLYGIYQGGGFPGLITSVLAPVGIAVVAGFCLLVGAIVWGWRQRQSAALFGILYMASFATTANLFFPIGATFGERLAYLPSIWYCAAVAELLAAAARRYRVRQLFFGGVLVYLVLLGGRCVVRNIDFSSAVALWQKDVENNPENSSALTSLAESLATRGDAAAAEKTYRRVFETPGGDTPQALRSWANFLLRQQRFAEAIEASTRAVELLRGYKDPEVVYAMGQLAYACAETGQFDQALFWLDQGGTFYRDASGDWDLRGRILEGLGRHAEAAEAYAHVQQWPPLSDGPLRYAQALFRSGNFDLARATLEQWLNDYETAEGWNLLGVVLAKQGEWKDALTAFERAVKLAPGDGHFQDNLNRARQAVGNR